jgi:uncharacterized repeat protein (TIGR03803 family)
MKRDRYLVTMLLGVVTILMVMPDAGAQIKHKILYEFKGGGDASTPHAGLIFDGAGNLYGTTFLGGTYGDGTVFQISLNSHGRRREKLLHSFGAGLDGLDPEAALILDQAGNLYGTTNIGGEYYGGTVFKLTPKSDESWAESIMYSFCHTTACLDGGFPLGGLIFDQAGNLYGTTAYGGTSLRPGGTVFKLTPNSHGAWTESVLYSFCSLTECADGEGPGAGLILDQAGNLYGTTEQGGEFPCHDREGCGVVFELTPNQDGSWTESVLHSFSGKDGNTPRAGLIFDNAGDLYGTTNNNGYGGGTAFELTPKSDGTWAEKVLRRFTGKDGSDPNGGLIFDGAGNLYGTTSGGGNPTCEHGCGVVFKLVPNLRGGWTETVLWSLGDHPAAGPIGGLIFDKAGNLFGTTTGSPLIGNFGSVFEVTP